ncbi:hypothetical protein CI109_106002 [Kwoniella shandongensis]|uniref:Uncharacterized protein n=1 Tax=Kwoniella shandongensis TaxID=1734106 RepID=A0A5M6BZ68_9TREE|nr:uncharacterized protein CI109_003950 [Kwoniella shandongensis]KAA5527691.1 hypothetical protein CI109_003950 [Kwoniella shandongensis]
MSTSGTEGESASDPFGFRDLLAKLSGSSNNGTSARAGASESDPTSSSADSSGSDSGSDDGVTGKPYDGKSYVWTPSGSETDSGAESDTSRNGTRRTRRKLKKKKNGPRFADNPTTIPSGDESGSGSESRGRTSASDESERRGRPRTRDRGQSESGSRSSSWRERLSRSRSGSGSGSRSRSRSRSGSRERKSPGNTRDQTPFPRPRDHYMSGALPDENGTNGESTAGGNTTSATGSTEPSKISKLREWFSSHNPLNSLNFGFGSGANPNPYPHLEPDEIEPGVKKTEDGRLFKEFWDANGPVLPLKEIGETTIENYKEEVLFRRRYGAFGLGQPFGSGPYASGLPSYLSRQTSPSLFSYQNSGPNIFYRPGFGGGTPTGAPFF